LQPSTNNTSAPTAITSNPTRLDFISPPASRVREVWEKRGCCCTNSELCKKLMHEWAALGEEYRHMLDWYYIPQRTAKTTNTGTHVNGYHDGCLRHLIGEGINAKEAKETKQWHSNKTRSIAVAVHHFKPCLRDAVQKSRNHSKMLMKHRCSRDEGRGTASWTNAD
jgi:hypothetical protein